MKILQLGKYYHPIHGGIETMLRNLSEGLVSAGHEVTVLCSSDTSSRTEESINGVRVVRAPFFGTLFSQPISPTLPYEVHQLGAQADLVHIHCPNPLAEASAFALPPRLPLVVSYHSDVVRQKLLLPLYSPLLHHFLNRANRVVVATRNHISHSPFLSGIEEKCSVIPYGIDASPFQPTPEIERQAEELRKQHGRFLLFVGRLVSYKGVHILLEAMERIETNLVIVGSGPLEQDLKLQADRLRIRSRVKFLGNLASGDSLVACYRAALMLVLPSITKAEAFGLVQVEAMACGRPTIATRLDSGVTLVNEEGITGLQVEPGNPAELSTAINRLLRDEPLREKMGRAARERFELLFTRERMVASYLQLYTELTRQ